MKFIITLVTGLMLLVLAQAAQEDLKSPESVTNSMTATPAHYQAREESLNCYWLDDPSLASLTLSTGVGTSVNCPATPITAKVILINDVTDKRACCEKR